MLICATYSTRTRGRELIIFARRETNFRAAALRPVICVESYRGNQKTVGHRLKLQASFVKLKFIPSGFETRFIPMFLMIRLVDSISIGLGN